MPPFIHAKFDINCAYLFIIRRDWKLLNYKEEHILEAYLWIGSSASNVTLGSHRKLFSSIKMSNREKSIV